MIRFIVGLFFVIGASGRHDFYDECLRAADCVASNPPSLLMTIIIALFGLILMLWPAIDGTFSKYEK